MEITKVFGAPGTGKTTWLLRKLEKLVDGKDTKLGDVVFVSFSNPAVNEFCSRLGVTKGSRVTPFFRTLHGLCLSYLVKTDEEIQRIVRAMHKYGFVEALEADFCKELGIPYEYADHGASDALGNRAFTAWSAIIGERYPKLKDVQKCLDLLFKVDSQFADIIEAWLRVKEAKGFLDFNDFLIEAYEREIYIDAKLGFFDEVQDFNRLEFEVMQKIIEGIEQIFLAGDDDQAIYGWKGAQPEFFLNVEGEEIVLPKTWRLSSKIWGFASGIIKQVRQRREKTIEPANEGGAVAVLPKRSLEEFVVEAAKFALRQPNLTVYLLFRTNRMVWGAEKILLERLIPFKRLKGQNLWDKELITAWNVVAKLRRNIKLNISEMEFLIKHAHPDILPHEYKKPALKALKDGSLPLEFYELLSKKSPEKLLSLRSKKNEKVVRQAWNPIEPSKINLHVDTIHAAKGKECDIVFIADAITPTISSSLKEFRDAELRVYYVGVTRARKAVVISPLFGFKTFLTSEVLIHA